MKVCAPGYAGLLWSKQFYNYVIRDWLAEIPRSHHTPPERNFGRNRDGLIFSTRHHLDAGQMGNPWFAAWDLAFHMIPFSKNRSATSRRSQLNLFLREWYMHRTAKMPAYEFAFGDVIRPSTPGPPGRVYKMNWSARAA